MSDRPMVLQKLLMPWVARAIIEQGHTTLTGTVVAAGDAASLTTPSAVITAYGLDGPDGPFAGEAGAEVFVTRFQVDPLMSLTAPRPGSASWFAGLGHGFLRGDVPIPVWDVERTRYPTGTELWRIAADGSQQLVAAYFGAALGWRGGRGYTTSVHLIGARARYAGIDFVADLSPDGAMVDLVSWGESAPPGLTGFVQARPTVWHRSVARAECESVFEVVVTGLAHGVPVRVVQRTPTQVYVTLGEVTDDAVTALGAAEVEPGVYDAVLPTPEVEQLRAVSRELA